MRNIILSAMRKVYAKARQTNKLPALDNQLTAEKIEDNRDAKALMARVTQGAQ